MPIRIGQISHDLRTVTVSFAGETFTVTYRTSGFTPETEDRLFALLESQRGASAIVEVLAACLDSWEVLGDDGKPLPPTKENLRRLPVVFLNAVVTAIYEDMRPNPPRSEA